MHSRGGMDLCLQCDPQFDIHPGLRLDWDSYLLSLELRRFPVLLHV